MKKKNASISGKAARLQGPNALDLLELDIGETGVKVIEDLPSIGLFNPEDYVFGESLEKLVPGTMDSLEAYEAAGRNLMRLGLMVGHLGQRLVMSNHAYHPGRLMDALARLQIATRTFPVELRRQTDAAVRWCPQGMIEEGSVEDSVVAQLVATWQPVSDEQT